MKTKSPYSVMDALNNLHRLDQNYWSALISNGMPGLEIITAPEVLAAKSIPKQDQLQNMLFFSDDDGMPGIVTARYTHDVVKRSGKVVDDLALAFVTPLRPDHHHRFHSLRLSCPHLCRLHAKPQNFREKRVPRLKDLFYKPWVNKTPNPTMEA
jgi:hypothetical protein